MCNDGLRRPSWEDVRKLSRPQYNEVDKEEFEDVVDFDGVEGNVDHDNAIRTDYGDNDSTDVDEMIITNKVNDKFDVSSHGSDVNTNVDFPHGSVTSVGKNMTSDAHNVKNTDTSKKDGGDSNDRMIKGKDSKVSKAKGKSQIKFVSSENNASTSITHSTIALFLLPLQMLAAIWIRS